MAMDGNYRSRAEGTAVGRPPWDAPPPGHTDQVTPPGLPPRPGARTWWVGRTWWVLPFCGGVVGVIAVAAIVIALHHALANPHRASASATAQPMPTEMFPDALFSKLTAAIQAGDEKAFLGLAAPGARPAMQTWWQNLSAIGFTTGAVIPTASSDTVRIDGQGDGSTVVLAGVHNALDPSYEGRFGVPLERYRIGLHFASATATGQITSWRPLDDDPWDQAGGLYVRQGTNVVVAGPRSDSGFVDETLPLAQTAAAYDIGLLHQVHSSDLLQEGFVVFVSGSPEVRDGWFAADPQPTGWPLAWNGDRVFEFPGPGTSSDDYTSAPDGIADDTTGGAAVVLTPYEQDGETPQQETTGLEREFMIDILAAHDQDLINGPAASNPPPAWAIEGLGIAMEALYSGNTNPAPASYSFGPLPGAVRSLPSSYKTGRLPDAQQLVSPSATDAQDWNTVAASVYEYIESKYGMNQMLASAMLLWTRYNTPFGNVEDVAQSSGNTFAFYTQATVESGWRSWLARS
jgi:hypothetical protein